MFFKKGKDRYVLVLPAIGVVIKFPVIKLRQAFKRIFHDARDGKLIAG